MQLCQSWDWVLPHSKPSKALPATCSVARVQAKRTPGSVQCGRSFNGKEPHLYLEMMAKEEVSTAALPMPLTTRSARQTHRKDVEVFRNMTQLKDAAESAQTTCPTSSSVFRCNTLRERWCVTQLLHACSEGSMSTSGMMSASGALSMLTVPTHALHLQDRHNARTMDTVATSRQKVKRACSQWGVVSIVGMLEARTDLF